MQNRIKIDRISINGDICAVFGCSLKYTFEFSVPGGAAGLVFEFSLPERAAVSGFSIINGGIRLNGAVLDAAQKGGGRNIRKDFAVSVNTGGLCRFTARTPISAGSFVLEITAVVLMPPGRDGAQLVIPLEARPYRVVDTDTDLPGAVSKGCGADISVVINEKSICRVYSPTHKIDCEVTAGGRVVNANTVTGGEFVLNLDYRELGNRAYISGESGGGRTGVYLFSLPEEKRALVLRPLLIILDSDGFKNTNGRIAAECVLEMLRYVNNLSKCMIAEINGRAFSAEPQYVSNINPSEVSAWLYSKERGGGSLSEVIDSFVSHTNGGEVVLVTCSGRAYEVLAHCQMAVNVLSVSQAVAEYGLTELAEGSGGIYAKTRRNPDYERFIKGFMERINSSRLSGLKIKEYAAGTYFSLPETVGSYRMGDVVFYTFRTLRDYPEQLFAEADGGFSDIIRFDSISVLPESNESNDVFAVKVFEELYRCIMRGDIAPESAAEFKTQAVKLSKEFNVACPDTEYSLCIDGEPGLQCGADVFIQLGQSALFDNSGRRSEDEAQPCISVKEVTVLHDTKPLTAELRRSAVLRGIYILLACMRSDCTFSRPYGGSGGKTETMYAAAAISMAADCGFLTDRKAFKKISEDAALAAGIDLSRAKPQYGEDDIKEWYKAESALGSFDIIRISKIIMALCTVSPPY